jgi:hypothetical protein
MDAMQARAANAFKLALESDQVVVEFGQVVEPGSAAGAAGVAVADRVILTLDVARRLAFGLNDSLKPHRAAIAAEEAKALPPSEAALAARPGQASVRAPLNEAGERAAQLLRLVGDLGVPHQYERSFRICDRALLANRFLLSLDTGNIPGNALARTLEICDRLRIPGSAREAAEANFTMAKCIHFGFESDDEAIVCKLYLERAVPAAEVQRAREGGQPALLHLALKWDLIKGTAVTTRYFWRPALSAAEIEDRLAQIYRDGPQASLALAKAVLHLTEGRVATEQLQFLEVEEAENARRSFDLNLYNAHLQVSDMQHLLHRMREHFNVRPGRLQALYDQIKGKALGHLAGGVHRDGKDFFNIYYGVVGLPGDASEAKALPPSEAALTARPGQASVRAPLNEAGERAAQLLRLVGDLGVPYQHERSFRICDRALLANRFLLTLDAGNIPGNALERTLEICDNLRIPGSARETAEANFAMAKCIHFAFESDDEAIVCKLYLERAVPPPEVQRAREDGQPTLLGLALKWDLIKGAAVTTRYFWRPALSAVEIEDRLAHVYQDGPQASLALAKAVLHLTNGRVAAEQLQYLEVGEAENARQSFDLNLYNARLQVSDMQHLLHRMREHFNVQPGRLQALYDQIKGKALGHLAGGVHRNGEDFFNIYYGAVGLPYFNQQLR